MFETGDGWRAGSHYEHWGGWRTLSIGHHCANWSSVPAQHFNLGFKCHYSCWLDQMFSFISFQFVQCSERLGGVSHHWSSRRTHTHTPVAGWQSVHVYKPLSSHYLLSDDLPHPCGIWFQLVVSLSLSSVYYMLFGNLIIFWASSSIHKLSQLPAAPHPATQLSAPLQPYLKLKLSLHMPPRQPVPQWATSPPTPLFSPTDSPAGILLHPALHIPIFELSINLPTLNLCPPVSFLGPAPHHKG